MLEFKHMIIIETWVYHVTIVNILKKNKLMPFNATHVHYTSVSLVIILLAANDVPILLSFISFLDRAKLLLTSSSEPESS